MNKSKPNPNWTTPPKEEQVQHCWTPEREFYTEPIPTPPNGEYWNGETTRFKIVDGVFVPIDGNRP